MPRSGWAREPQLLGLSVWSLCSATREAAIVTGPHTAMKSGPHSPRLERALAQKRRPNTAKNKINIIIKKKTSNHGTSLVVQWVRLCAPNAGGPGSIPSWGTRSRMHAATKSRLQLRVRMLQLRSPHAATKRSCMLQQRSRMLQLRPSTAKINK